MDDDQLPLGLEPGYVANAAPYVGDRDLGVLLVDPAVRARFEGKVFRGGGPDACHPWLGAISDSGHGKFHVGGGPFRRVVTAHRYAYQLVHGPIAGGTVMHECDEHGCQNVTAGHVTLGTVAGNTQDYYDRVRTRVASPLADPRGRRGRAVAIRDAVLAAGPDPGRATGCLPRRVRDPDAMG